MLPRFPPLNTVHCGGVYTKLLGDFANGLSASSQLALDLQHLGLRQHCHATLTLTAGLASLTLRLAYGFCPYNFFANGQGDGLLGISQINLDVLARINNKTGSIQSFDDFVELGFRKDVHVHWMERVQCSREEWVCVNF